MPKGELTTVPLSAWATTSRSMGTGYSSRLQMNRRRHNFRFASDPPGIRTFRLFGATEALR